MTRREAGRWEPSAVRRPAAAPSVMPRPARWGGAPQVRDDLPGRPQGCVWWLLLAGALALPAVVLIVALADQAFR